MRKVIAINCVPYGSTIKISLGILEQAQKNGYEVYSAAGFSTHPISELPPYHFQIGNVVSKKLHQELASFTGRNGCYSRFSTKQFIKKIEEISPDIIHLHNIHGWYINLPMLFDYIKRKGIKVVWTLHDCWAFTGHCPHFAFSGCEKWKTECNNCPSFNVYPRCRFDDSTQMFRRKKKWFSGVESMTLVTPSQWLADLVKSSFLKTYPVEVINNGIDLDVYKPINSDFKAKHKLDNKFVLLGVSFAWEVRKGFDVFVELSKRLGEEYKIIMVGVDNKTAASLPDSIIQIPVTQNQRELVEIYSAADLFVNPTREDTFPTVNLEALACGTPVLTFETGGSPETVDDTCGVVVPCDDIDALEEQIHRIKAERPYTEEACVNRAQRFDMNKRFMEYVDLYNKL